MQDTEQIEVNRRFGGFGLSEDDEDEVDYLADRTVARSEQSRAGYSAFETRGKTHQNSALNRF